MANDMNMPPLWDNHCGLIPAMRKVIRCQMPETHPISKIETEYSVLAQKCQKQFVPDYAEFLITIGRDLADFCVALCPVEGDPFIDFVVMRNGSKVPGMADVAPGHIYSQGLLPEVAGERLMELASCLALKKSRLSEAVSARKGALNIKVYRGVFPVWNSVKDAHGVVLAIAPVYASI